MYLKYYSNKLLSILKRMHKNIDRAKLSRTNHNGTYFCAFTPQRINHLTGWYAFIQSAFNLHQPEFRWCEVLMNIPHMKAKFEKDWENIMRNNAVWGRAYYGGDMDAYVGNQRNACRGRLIDAGLLAIVDKHKGKYALTPLAKELVNEVNELKHVEYRALCRAT